MAVGAHIKIIRLQMGRKWEKKHQCSVFSVGKCHIIHVFDFTLWLLITKIYLSINKNKVLPWVLGTGVGQGGGGKSAKLGNGYCYCEKRAKTTWKSKILEGRFKNVVKGKIEQFGVYKVIQFPPPPSWLNLKSRQNIDKISK